MPAQDNEAERLLASPGFRPEPGWGERLMPSTPVGPPSFFFFLKDQGISLTCRILKNVKMTNKDPHTPKQREYERRAGAENSSYRF